MGVSNPSLWLFFHLEPKWPGHREDLLPPFHPIKQHQPFCFEIALLSLKHSASSVTSHPPSFWSEAVAITTDQVGLSLTNIGHLGAPLLHLPDFVAPLHCGLAFAALVFCLLLVKQKLKALRVQRELPSACCGPF